jgi:hypothetical protein
MVDAVDKLLRKEQAGFCSGRSCIDLISILRIIIQQAVQFLSPLYQLFIDYEKAFDIIDRKFLWVELHNIGVPAKILSFIHASYENFSCRVLHDGCTSAPFQALSGVRQGCLLSSLLFLLEFSGILEQKYKFSSLEKLKPSKFGNSRFSRNKNFSRNRKPY